MSLWQHSHRYKRVICAGVALFILSAFPQPSRAGLTSLEIASLGEEKHEVPVNWAWLKNLSDYRKTINEKYGTNFAFLFNYTQQLILHSSHDEGKSRGVWYWNLGVEQKLWPSAKLFAELEMDKGRGVDKFLPTFSEFNSNTGRNIFLYVPRFYLEQSFLGDKITVSAGKLDLSDWFDGSAVAGSADTQFLSDALVNNLAIPFPSKGIGALVNFKPSEWFYFQSGAASGRANSAKIGLSDAFNNTFFINELGFTPKINELAGNYRFIFNLNHENLEEINSDETKKNDLAFALSFDQAVTKRVTLFLRYGFGNQKVRYIEHFWSCGAQVSEPIPGRKFDVLGIGVAQSIFGNDYCEANEEDTGRPETIYEAYYSYNLNNVCTLTPDIQVVTNPDSDRNAATEVVIGLRFLLSF